MEHFPMIDLRLDSNLDIVFGDAGPEFVSGGNAQEQAMKLALVAYYDSLMGQTDGESILKKILLRAERVADLLGFLDTLDRVNVEYSESEANTILVRLVYSTGETSEMTL